MKNVKNAKMFTYYEQCWACGQNFWDWLGKKIPELAEKQMASVQRYLEEEEKREIAKGKTR